MIILLLKLLVGLACLALLAHLGAIDIDMLARVTVYPEYLFIAFSLLASTVPIAAWRWLTLLRGARIDQTFKWCLSTTAISLLFNTFLPGAYGGDLVRLALASRTQTKSGEMSQIIFSVVVDRLSGLAALLVFAITVLPLLPIQNHQNLIWISTILTMGLICGVFIAIKAGDWVADLIEKMPTPIGPVGARFVRGTLSALRSYIDRPALLVGVLIISLVQYALVLAALAILGRAMEINDLSAVGYVVAGVWGLVANALPVTPGGLGVGESAFASMAAFMSNNHSATAGYANVFLASRVFSVLISLGGLFPLIFGKISVKRQLFSETKPMM